MIVAEFGNSTNVTERELQRQAMQFTGTMLAFGNYLVGQRLYMSRWPIDTCRNEYQRSGWNDAAHYDALQETATCATS